MSDFLFSIVIPTCNRNDLLAKCLDSLHDEVQQGRTTYEVIVTDDGKNNEARILIDQNYTWVKWVDGPKRGPAANRNNGVGYAKGEWLIFVDDDCQPDNGLLNAYHEAILTNPGCEVFEGRIYADRQKSRMDEEAPLNETGGFLWSCNFMIKKERFETLGCFNETFPYAAMEDVEFYDRIQKVTETRFVRSAAVMHPWRRVHHPFKKFQQAYISHQIYFSVNPKARQRFKILRYGRLIIHSILRFTIPEVIRFRGRGIQFPLAYHWFQLKILLYSNF